MDALANEHEEIRQHDRLMRRVRLGAVVFAVVQLWVYAPPAGIERPFHPGATIAVVCGALLAVSAVSWIVGRRGRGRWLRRSARAQVVVDAAIALALVALFAFDPESNVWAVMLVPVMEGAVRHRLRGALAAWAGQMPAYVLLVWWATTVYPHVDPRPSQVTFVVGIVGLVAAAVGWLASDLHERTEQYRRAQARLADLVLVDDLTRLANRARLLGALDRLDGTSEPYTVAFLDLVAFKEVNDVHGHETGDELLHVVARRLEDSVRPTDLVARLAGDEFVVVLPGLHERGAVLDALDRVADAATVEAVVDGHVVEVGVSVGAATVLATGPRPSGREVLRQADAAMYVAKRRGGPRPVVVDACPEPGREPLTRAGAAPVAPARRRRARPSPR